MKIRSSYLGLPLLALTLAACGGDSADDTNVDTMKTDTVPAMQPVDTIPAPMDTVKPDTTSASTGGDSATTGAKSGSGSGATAGKSGSGSKSTDKGSDGDGKSTVRRNTNPPGTTSGDSRTRRESSGGIRLNTNPPEQGQGGESRPRR